MKKIFHPHHRTAWSLRTSGLPLVAVTMSGETVRIGSTRKAAGYIDVPDDAVAILWCYSSNTGRRTVHVLEPRDGLPAIVSIADSNSPNEVDAALDPLPAAARSAAATVVSDWIWG